MKISFWIIFIVIKTGLVNASCSICYCTTSSSGTNVNCNLLTNGYIPNLPRDTYSLYLRNNEITEIDIQICKEMPQLQYIHFSNNLISEIPQNTFADCEQLRRIYLQNNQIQSIERNTFINMPNLNYIHLYSNRIRSIEINSFINLPRLTELSLYRNVISTIEPFTFMNLPSLRYLSLHENSIELLQSYTFVNLTNLVSINLYSNYITTIESFTFMNLPSLTNLHLTTSPLNCDCSIYPFWSWLIERASIGTTSKCSNGTLVTSLQSAALETCNPDNCQCFNGGTCVSISNGLGCECIGHWTGEFCQESQCVSYDCGIGHCYIEPVNGTAQCVCDDRYVDYCTGSSLNQLYNDDVLRVVI